MQSDSSNKPPTCPYHIKDAQSCPEGEGGTHQTRGVEMVTMYAQIVGPGATSKLATVSAANLLLGLHTYVTLVVLLKPKQKPRLSPSAYSCKKDSAQGNGMGFRHDRTLTIAWHSITCMLELTNSVLHPGNTHGT